MAPVLSLSAVSLALFSAVSFGSLAIADDAALEAPAAQACSHSVTAKIGDSCVSLATANGLTVSQFLQINPTVRSCTLSAGVAYCVSADPSPVASPPPASSTSAPASSAPASSAPAPPASSAIPPPPPPPPPTSSTAKPPAKPSSSSPSSSSPTSSAAHSPAPPASSSSSSVAAVPSQSSTGLIPSPDGSDGICGGQYTCLGSVYGDCCSANGYCGNTTEYCGEGCNPAYGDCGLCPAAVAATTVTAFYTTTSILFSTTTTTALVTVTAPASTVTVTTTPRTPTTSRPAAVATPNPTFPGTVKNCIRWYLVRATDSCRRIALTYGTSQVQITTWNPGFDCDDIEDMAGNYICVGVQQQAAIGPFGGF